jgi:hypothetical protein
MSVTQLELLACDCQLFQRLRKLLLRLLEFTLYGLGGELQARILLSEVSQHALLSVRVGFQASNGVKDAVDVAWRVPERVLSRRQQRAPLSLA